jgi:hypothetical protein
MEHRTFSRTALQKDIHGAVITKEKKNRCMLDGYDTRLTFLQKNEFPLDIFSRQIYGEKSLERD